ncbi:ABC transporter permease [Caldimonas tepidiphila]|uniref:ABC transporter permease n=1 Tax=Caldimonas tepidiphila TaxID=2315841 RepID=UPI000E5A1809|nr:MlaE family lipid ABC transporter permease subunit [Caldimonas tepidiphila]
MSEPGSLRLERGAAGDRLVVAGDWTLDHLPRLLGAARALAPGDAGARAIDARGLGRLDTAGASLLLELGASPEGADGSWSEPQRALLAAVARAGETPPAHAAPTNGLADVLAHAGRAVATFVRDTLALLGFVGLILSALARTLPRPRRWRVTSLVFHIEQAGLDAVPIVALLSFSIGAVVAFLGATVLREFGATVFTVELLGISFLREFGVLLTAIMVAGRSGSAFTAQIGSMKAREEVDAIRTLGLSPIEVLALPRVLALLVAMPLLTFIAMMAGVFGGAIVGMLALDISPALFVSRFQATTVIDHFWVGMSKAPVFAFLIASIGCLEGFKVSGSAESVGAHTTSSVVQSIFTVILVDALAALFYLELDI